MEAAASVRCHVGCGMGCTLSWGSTKQARQLFHPCLLPAASGAFQLMHPTEAGVGGHRLAGGAVGQNLHHDVRIYLIYQPW